MSEKSKRKPQSPPGGRAYTGKTIVQGQRAQAGHKAAGRQGKAAGPQLPPLPRVYQNPPPSQRSRSRARPEQQAAPSAAAAAYDHAGQAGHARQARQQTDAPHRSLGARIKRTLRLTLVLVLVVLVAGFLVLQRQAHAVAETVVVPDVRSNPSLATPLVGSANVLLIGVDERPDSPEEGVRSDTLILARINGPGGWVSLLSIPRDTLVEIPGIGQTKINIAYGEGYVRAEQLYGPGTTPQQGGMALAAETVESFLVGHGRSTRIDYTAQVNFDGFVGIIDALGGITVDVPTYILDTAYPTDDFGYTTVEFQPGPQRMDGQTALIYARTRHADSDFGRAQRQQQVMRAIVAELQARGWTGQLSALPDLLSSMEGQEGSLPPVITTMAFDRPDILLGLMLFASGATVDDVARYQLSPDVVGVTELGSDLVWDTAGVQLVVDQWRSGPSAAPASPTAQSQQP
jgi:LCP family protein required for cell wall assembly